MLESTNLPKTSNAGIYRKSLLGIFSIARKLTWMNDTRSYERHLPDQHIEELWKFIQACLTQKTSNSSNTWIAFQLHVLLVLSHEFWTFSQILICIDSHRSKLQSIETTTILANDFPKMEYILAIIEFNTSSNDHEDRDKSDY